MTINQVFEGKAYSRYVRVSPLKVRRVLDQIRGRSYEESIIILKFMPHKVCPIISKLLYSAVSNAKRSFSVQESLLFVIEAKADEASFYKRFCAHAQGRGFPIKKRRCHITIKVGLI